MAELTDKELRAQIESKMRRLTEFYNVRMRKYRLALEALEEDNFDMEPPSHQPSKQLTINGTVATEKKTSTQKIEEQLAKDDMPLTGKEIETLTGINSGTLSYAYRTASSAITIFEVDEAPLKLRFFYVLKSWLTPDGDLKQTYQDKIFNKHGVRRAA